MEIKRIFYSFLPFRNLTNDPKYLKTPLEIKVETAKESKWNSIKSNLVAPVTLGARMIGRIATGLTALFDDQHALKVFLHNLTKKEAERTVLAEELIQNDGKSLARYFDYYSISKADKRKLIAKKLVKENALELSKYFKKFEIEQAEDRLEIATEAMRKNCHKVFECLSNFRLLSRQNWSQKWDLVLPNIYKKIVEGESLEGIAPLLDSLIIDIWHSKEDQDFWKELIKKIPQEEPLVQIKLYQWLVPFLMTFLLNPALAEKIKEKEIQETILSIFQYRDVAKREYLTNYFFEVISTKGIDYYLEMRKKFSAPHMRLPALILSVMRARREFDEEVINEILKTIAMERKANKKDRRFKDKGHLDTVIDFLHAISSEKELKLSEKNKILSLLFEWKEKMLPERHDLILIARDLLVMGYGGQLKAVSTREEIRKKLENLFIEAFSLEDMADVAQKYQNTFAKFRIKNAIFTFLGKLKTDGQSEAIAQLKQYVRLVLNGKLSESRNEAQDNPHFKAIFNNKKIKDKYPELKEKWAAGDSVPASKLLKGKKNIEGWTVQDTEDPCDLLLMDTEVEGSCMSIYKERNCQYVLATLLDGKNRAIVIKDENGKIIGQLLLRLLWDKQRQIPVLGQERIYPHNSPRLQDMQELLDAMCLKRAKDLNLPLVSVYNKTKQYYPLPVESLGGPTRFEYIDPLHTKGRNQFTIKDTYLIFQPNAV